MNKLSPAYQVITYILLVVACLLCLVDLFALLASLASLAMLPGVIMLSGVIVYTFTSFYFMRTGILKGNLLKRKLYLWMRATAIITAIFGVMTLVDSVVFINHPSAMSEYYNQAIKMQPAYASAGFTKDAFISMFSVMLYICEGYCLLLLLHVTLTFGLLKKHGNLFGKKDEQPPQ